MIQSLHCYHLFLHLAVKLVRSPATVHKYDRRHDVMCRLLSTQRTTPTINLLCKEVERPKLLRRAICVAFLGLSLPRGSARAFGSMPPTGEKWWTNENVAVVTGGQVETDMSIRNLCAPEHHISRALPCCVWHQISMCCAIL